MEISISNNDYQLACKKVQQFLDQISIEGDCGGEDCNVKLADLPSADDIVDAVWEAIR